MCLSVCIHVAADRGRKPRGKRERSRYQERERERENTSRWLHQCLSSVSDVALLGPLSLCLSNPPLLPFVSCSPPPPPPPLPLDGCLSLSLFAVELFVSPLGPSTALTSDLARESLVRTYAGPGRFFRCTNPRRRRTAARRTNDRHATPTCQDLLTTDLSLFRSVARAFFHRSFSSRHG